MNSAQSIQQQVSRLTLDECKQALVLGYTNYPSLAPDFRDEFNKRMAAIRERRNYLASQVKPARRSH